MERPLQITFKNMESSPAFEALIRRRAEALEKLHPQVMGCRVVVHIPHRSAASAKLPVGVSVEVEVPGRGMVVAKDEQERREVKDDHTAAINNAFDAVERQLDKLAAVQARDVKATESVAQSGMIVRVFPEQNYGFVQVDGMPELYFTRNAVAGGAYDEIEVGMMVEVEPATDEGPMGPQARVVRLLGRSRTPS